MVLLDVGLAAPDSLKGTCMNLSGVEGEAECAAIAPSEPALAQHITGRCSEIPGISTQSLSITGKGQPPCQRRERPSRG